MQQINHWEIASCNARFDHKSLLWAQTYFYYTYKKFLGWCKCKMYKETNKCSSIIHGKKNIVLSGKYKATLHILIYTTRTINNLSMIYTWKRKKLTTCHTKPSSSSGNYSNIISIYINTQFPMSILNSKLKCNIYEQAK